MNSTQSRKSSSSSGGQLNLRDDYEEPMNVIHRTGKRIVVAGDSKLYEPKLDEFHQYRGWKAPVHMPYRPLGHFQKVVPVIEQMKVIVRNSKEMAAETQKNVGKIKRNPSSIYRGVNAEHPKRTWGIMSKGVKDMRTRTDRSIDDILQQAVGNQNTGKKVQGYNIQAGQETIDLREVGQQDSSNLMHRMGNLEKNFMSIPLEKMEAKKPDSSRVESEDSEERQKQQELREFNNQRLMTPRTKKLSQKRDAAVMLKGEIGESMLRLKAAKFGRNCDQIAPQYSNSYYIPNKELYQTPQQKSKQDLQLGNLLPSVQASQENSPQRSIERGLPNDGSKLLVDDSVFITNFNSSARLSTPESMAKLGPRPYPRAQIQRNNNNASPIIMGQSSVIEQYHNGSINIPDRAGSTRLPQMVHRSMQKPATTRNMPISQSYNATPIFQNSNQRYSKMMMDRDHQFSGQLSPLANSKPLQFMDSVENNRVLKSLALQRINDLIPKKPTKLNSIRHHYESKYGNLDSGSKNKNSQASTTAMEDCYMEHM